MKAEIILIGLMGLTGGTPVLLWGQLPPPPPGSAIGSRALFSPKGAEQTYSLRRVRSSSSSTMTLKTALLPSGFVITNISISGGVVRLDWVNGVAPFQIEGRTGVEQGDWNLVSQTSERTASFAVSENRFWRVKAGSTGAGSTIWSKTLGSSGAVTAVATCPDGHLLVAGYFSGAIDFGGGVLTASGGTEIFLAKYSNAGTHVWSRNFGAAGDVAPRCIAVDYLGNILVGGYVIGTGQSTGDGFVAKYSPIGEPAWWLTFGANYSDQVNSIAADSQGNVIATGFFQGAPVTIAGTTLYDYGQADTFLAKWSPEGAGLWAKNFPPCGSFDAGSGVVVDISDNIYLAGTAANYIDLGGEAFSTPGGYLAKFDSGGNHVWSRMVGTNSAARIGGLALDHDGNLLLCGSFFHQTDLGGGLVHGGSGNFDMFVSKYSSSSGAYQWAWTSTGGLDAGATAVAIDLSNNVFLTGVFRGTYQVGGQSISNSSAGYDGFSLKFTGGGAPVWATRFGPGGGSATAVDSTGDPIVGGMVNSAAFVGRLNK